MATDLRKKIGSPDLIILFTNTVSHKLVHAAVAEAERCNADIIRCHSSSSCALKNALEYHCNGGNCANCEFNECNFAAGCVK